MNTIILAKADTIDYQYRSINATANQKNKLRT